MDEYSFLILLNDVLPWLLFFTTLFLILLWWFVSLIKHICHWMGAHSFSFNIVFELGFSWIRPVHILVSYLILNGLVMAPLIYNSNWITLEFYPVWQILETKHWIEVLTNPFSNAGIIRLYVHNNFLHFCLQPILGNNNLLPQVAFAARKPPKWLR